MGFLRQASLVLVTAVLVSILPVLLQPKLPRETRGTVAKGWEKVEKAFRENIDSGLENGGAFSVYHKGKLVVDLHGGYADPAVPLPWKQDTISCAFSTTKGVAGIAMGMLVDRGLLDFDKLVADYWPEFGQNGKEKVTVRQLVSHQAGLAAITKDFSAILLKTDPEKLGHILAEQKPHWTPGADHGYHPLVLALYLDQLVRRVDPKHRDIGTFFHEEIAIPFDIDFFIGLPKSEHYRSTRLSFPTLLDMAYTFVTVSKVRWMIRNLLFPDKNSLAAKVMTNPIEYRGDNLTPWFHNPDIIELPIASAQGHGTVLSIAKLWGIVANGGKAGGKTLLSSRVIDLLAKPVVAGVERTYGMNVTFSNGVLVHTNPEGGPIIGHPGYGGQMGFGDLRRNVGFGYITNHMSFYTGDDPRYLRLIDATYEALRDLGLK